MTRRWRVCPKARERPLRIQFVAVLLTVADLWSPIAGLAEDAPVDVGEFDTATDENALREQQEQMR